MSDSFVGVRLPKEAKERLKQAADERGTSLSEYIREIFGGHEYIRGTVNAKACPSDQTEDRADWRIWAKRFFWGTIITGIAGGIAQQFGMVILEWLFSLF